MIKIGITGSLASGKTTVAKLMSKRRYPVFSADKVVADLYKKRIFLIKIKKKFHLKNYKNPKKKLKALIRKDKFALKKLESIIHPLVRKENENFYEKKSKIGLFEIPLLIENKLMKYFDVIIFVNAQRNKRLKRYKGNNEIFTTLDKRQIISSKKIKFSDHVINNNKGIIELKSKVADLINRYE